MFDPTLQTSLATALSGFVLGFGLIAAIGAQNAFILRQGVRRQHLLAVVLVCALSDIVLIFGGILGVGAVLEHAPWIVTLVRWFGVAFLTAYGLLAAKRAWRPSGRGLTVDDGAADATAPAPAGDEHPTPTEGGTAARTATLTRPTVEAPRAAPRGSLVTAILTALAFTWLNPHAYLDAVVVLGSVANTHGDPGRWIFGVGSITASFAWFTLIGFGARLLATRLASPRAWRILDAAIAVIMLSLAVSLAVSA
ncbi:LysE/ArgO family amino acid transporter [Salinibacterium sp. SYSU T00001]|uniref:LysE/ArgO family amino acid transporter n=1 Tax=Homoserinimonas sedimenticola TaxID=2986805 RepID=UPI0022359512|nr:LysE/ArgO family amino acid transporter [Salinibacterium sedimenticola]MCW4385252.1 LysE/ArgO family amino acid transporter [Salinibacterium sedimenticola]